LLLLLLFFLCSFFSIFSFFFFFFFFDRIHTRQIVVKLHYYDACISSSRFFVVRCQCKSFFFLVWSRQHRILIRRTDIQKQQKE
jgi:hypothetical protein